MHLKSMLVAFARSVTARSYSMLHDPKTQTDKCLRSQLFPVCHSVSAHRSKRQVKEKPVDWLPFPWTMRPVFSVFDNSGDQLKTSEVDMSLPKVGFKFSDEFKIAEEDVKRIFSAATATIKERAEIEKVEILKAVQRHPLDFDSPEVKIALLTIKVRKLFELRNIHRKRTHLKVLLMNVIQQRNKLLKELYTFDYQCFKWLKEVLKLEYTPQPMGIVKEKYTKQWDLRRLTREYCQNMRYEKRAAFHEELKALQEEFMKEKEETLLWIDSEEKDLGIK